ncbi:hypothetical protein BACSP_02154 [Bacillus sp. T2.9-1]|nr:hypothetical protein BACSP_02154 [Bacillus sp. T2.9-1]
MKNTICPKCNSEEIKKGVMAASVGQAYVSRKKP